MFFSQVILFSRVKVLTQQKEYQLNDIKRCENEKENLRKGAEELAEKYEDVQANQQEIQRRYKYILFNYTSNYYHYYYTQIRKYF